MKYVLFFALTYVAFFVIVSILLSIVAEPMTGLFYAVIMFGSARVPAYRFLKDNKRLYTRLEKQKLIVGSFLSSLMIDLLTINRTTLHLDISFVLKEMFNLLILWYIFGGLSKSLSKPSKAER